MNTAIDIAFARRMTKLLKEFFTKKDITPNEFIDWKVLSEDPSGQAEQLYEKFLLLMKHEEFFDLMVKNFWYYYDLKFFNKDIITTLMFIIIFELNKENSPKVAEIFTDLNYRFCANVLEYFTVEDNMVDVAEAGCKVFDNDYILERILHPLLNKNALIETLYTQVNNTLKERRAIIKKPLTKPIAPTFASKPTRIPAPPTNTLSDMTVFKSSQIPRAVVRGDYKARKKLAKALQENMERAAKLLQFAREKAFRVANVEQKPKEESPPPSFRFKPKKIPPKKDVVIKGTAASLMREAAILGKDREEEIKKIEALTQAVFDPTALELLEKDIQKCKEQEHLQDIEKKHLQGLLTYEEAILAKQNLLKINQEKMEEFKKERVEILAEIDIWREQEQEKIRILVEKCQNIEKAARDAEKKMYQNKRIRALSVELESKELLQEAYKKKEEELACRVKLIQELRALEQVRSLHVKEFDPTESPNFGFLCEMSIAELQERLNLMKIELQEELERRKKAIADSRLKQQQLLESVKRFIAQSRIPKPKPVPRSPLKLEQTPDLTALRERLQQARQNRLDAQQSSVY